MIFDTDVLIWAKRGVLQAAEFIDQHPKRYISIQTFMELLQRPQSKNQQKIIKKFLHDLDFQILPLTENIGYRAAVYIEEYFAATGLTAGDALIAATAIENTLPLATGNLKHFRDIKKLELCPFKLSTK